MGLFYLIALVLLFAGVKICNKGQYFDDYTSKEQAIAIKGLFILMVFICHYISSLRSCGYGLDT